MGHPDHFFVLFSSFETIVKDVHRLYGAGIRTPRPLEHESPPITTRPVLEEGLLFGDFGAI